MEVQAVEGLPEVRPGDDVGELIASAADVGPDDVVCVASTIVSKAEGRQADLDEFEPGPRAREVAARIGEVTDERKDPRFAQAVLAESEELLLSAPILLAATRFGHVTVNAGIDRSNVPDADLLLLPEDPSASARRIRDGLAGDAGTHTHTRTGARTADPPAVVVIDTSGRPFRQGQRGVALGWDGIPAARDWRGERDRDGRELDVTVQAVVDELAGAANLVAGEGAGGTPAAVVRDFAFGDHDGHDELYRSRADDLVRQALVDWEWRPGDGESADGATDRPADGGTDEAASLDADHAGGA